jgi:hypothetical protein
MENENTAPIHIRTGKQCCGSGSRVRCLSDSGIRNRFFLDPESQTHIFDSLGAIFVIFAATKKG